MYWPALTIVHVVHRILELSGTGKFEGAPINGLELEMESTTACGELGADTIRIAIGDDETGSLGIVFTPVSIMTVCHGGLAQRCCSQPLAAGMVLREINGVPAEFVPYCK